MYLENFTQRNELMEVEILQISRHPRKQTENSIKKEHRKMRTNTRENKLKRKPSGVTLYTERKDG